MRYVHLPIKTHKSYKFFSVCPPLLQCVWGCSLMCVRVYVPRGGPHHSKVQTHTHTRKPWLDRIYTATGSTDVWICKQHKSTCWSWDRFRDSFIFVAKSEIQTCRKAMPPAPLLHCCLCTLMCRQTMLEGRSVNSCSEGREETDTGRHAIVA